MHNQAERRTWPQFIPERFRIHRDINTRNIGEFLEIVAKKHPAQINISVIEKAITKDGSSGAVGVIDHYEFATLFSFSLDPKGHSIAKYVESYPESAVSAYSENPNPEEPSEMKIRALVTAINRTKQINSRFPSIQTQLGLADAEGKLPINEAMLRYIQKEAQRLKLSPFII